MSLAAIFVLAITTLLVTCGFFASGVTNFLVSTIENKIDVTAYFKMDAKEQDIFNIRDEILKDKDNIKSVEYVSKEEALNDFIEKHKDDSAISKAILEVGENPFLSSLNIRTTNASTYQYEQISNILQQEQFGSIIEKVDFSQKRGTIEKIFSITSSVSKFMWALIAVLVLVCVLVVFNTLKLIINGSKEEINTMKMVGAGNWFIKAPFIIQGIIFGLISFVVCFLITIFSVYFATPSLRAIMPGFNLFDYFVSNLWAIILIQLGFGVGLGIISSFIVVRKYLRV